jgi:hypothetical protein
MKPGRGKGTDRNRDSEIVDPTATREALMQAWEEGWWTVWEAIEPLTEGDLGHALTIRGEATRSYRRLTGNWRTTRITAGRS